LFPLANTIFRKTTTPLALWFEGIYHVSIAKNGMSATELARYLGVTYKTSWRMLKQIRLLMQQDGYLLEGTVQADETYVGGTRKKYLQKSQFDNKTPVIGIVEKNGMAKAIVAHGGANATVALPFLRAAIKQGSTLHTDESKIYSRVKRDFTHEFVNHSKYEYARAGVTTNAIEGFWSQMKRSIDGTHHAVSPKYLQAYVNQFVFLYNYRGVAVGPVLLEKALKPV
jgi:hypothetical protein